MADKKISALTSASTPLAGTEVLPIVQSGATVKVAVSDLTAGRAISASSLTAISNTTYQIQVASGTGNYTNGGIYFGALGTSDPNYYGYAYYDQTTETLRLGNRSSSSIGGVVFYTGAGTPIDQGRVDTSGRLLMGCTATDSGAKFRFQYASGQNGLQLFDNSGVSGSTFAIFAINSGGNSNIGSISRIAATAAVAYNTTSDYRLKENVEPLSNALDAVTKLKPVKYNYVTDKETQMEGFLAHEVKEVIPCAVTGEKDAVIEEEYEITPVTKDEMGNITPAVMGRRTIPVYQQLDTSFLVATLTAAIQELNAINGSLAARITALESK